MTSSPIFVFCHARTGSTLLRFILDAHDDICCPAEIELGKLCRAMSHTLRLTRKPVRADKADHDDITSAISRHVRGIMEEYCASKGKRRWCDKSVSNIDYMEDLAVFFPDAQFICLHRHCFDAIHSCSEIFRFGYPGRLGTFIARNPENVLEGLAESWCESTRSLLRFEQFHADRSVRVKYEDLVCDPTGTVQGVFEFLQIRFDPNILEAAFSRPHDEGPGDPKIRFATRIYRSRVGRRNSLPPKWISERILSSVNQILIELGYPKET